MLWIDSPRGGVPVYISGNLSKEMTIAPGQWGIVSIRGVRGLVSIAISNVTNPKGWMETVAGTYICKVYSLCQYTSENPPNPETDNNNLILVWKDTLGVMPVHVRVPGGTALVHVAVKNTTSGDTLKVIVSVEI